jgi:asparagine synthase (glutamine-hydrolysing)
MCGIAGIAAPEQAPAEREAAVRRMCARLHHRGPDDEGLVSVGAASIGMRRLAIFDPANGHQPWQSDDGRLTLVFNGAVTNFRGLRGLLEARGRCFRTECDTEVLLAAYEAWGAECLPRLRGMFAFAVWERDREELFLARDPFGVKPLYLHSLPGGGVAFASEVRALLAGLPALGAVDPAAVAELLAFLAVPAPRTLYRGVASLRPGEFVRWRAGRLDRTLYAPPGRLATDEAPASGPQAFTATLRHHLERSVAEHLLADVPVGLFLSGGLDSAAIAGLAVQAGAAPLRTFTVGFGEPGYNEAEAAAATARHLGCAHTAEVLTGSRVAADLNRLLDSMDQPTGDGLNTHYASRLAAAGGVRVVLSGLGADELFGGYGHFRQLARIARALPLWRLLPGAARRAAGRMIGRGSSRREKLGDFVGHATGLHELAALGRRVWSAAAVADLTGHPPARHGPFHPALPLFREALPRAAPFAAIGAWERGTYMTDVLLRDSDVMSMAHSLELRVPFLDRPLSAWLERQPVEWVHTPAHPKSALAAAVADLLPPDLPGRRKWGFTLPFPLWMRRELRPFLEDTFAPASVARSGLFVGEAVRRRWAAFRDGRDDAQWSRIWTLAVTIAFLNPRAR